MSIAPEVHLSSSSPFLPAIKSWEIFLNDQGRSPYTVKAFIGDLNLLAGYFPPDTTIGAVTTNDLNRFLNWLEKERGVPCSPKSLARRITSIKAFFRWLSQAGRLPVDPAEKVLQQSVISPLPQVLTAEEQEKVIKVAAAQRTAKKTGCPLVHLVAAPADHGNKER